MCKADSEKKQDTVDTLSIISKEILLKKNQTPVQEISA